MDKTILTLGVDSSQVGTAAAALNRLTEAGNTAATTAGKVAVATDAQAKKITGSLVPAASKGKLAFADLAAAAEKLGPKAAQQLARALEDAQQKAAKARAEFEALMATPAAPLAIEPRSVPAQVTAVTAAPSARTPLPAPQPVGTVAALPTAVITADAVRAQTAVERLTAAARDQRSALAQLSPSVSTTAGAYRQLAAAPIRMEAPQGISATAAALASVAMQATNANRALTGLNRTTIEAPRSVAAQVLAQQPVTPTAASAAANAAAPTSANAAATAQGSAAANALATAEDRAAESAQHLAQANARSEAAQARLNAALLRAAQAQAAYDAAQRDTPSNTNAIAAAQARLQSAQAGVSVATANAARAQQDAASASTRHSTALTQAGRQSQLSMVQIQGLTHSVRSFGEMLVAGQNPLKAFIMEAARLSGTFTSPGEVFRGVASLITPMRLAFAGAAVGVGAFALALGKAESAARSLNTVQAQLAGTGRKDLFTDASLRLYIAQLSQLPGVSHSAAEAIVSEFSKAHAIGGDLFKDLSGITADYAKATGQKIPEAAKDLAKAFSDPKRGVLELDGALGTLNSSTVLTVERLMRAGDIVGAQRALFDGLKASVKGLEEQSMTPLQRSVDQLGKSWDSTMRAMEKSDGLRTANSLLAKMIDGVGYLLQHSGGIANVFRTMTPLSLLGPVGRLTGLVPAEAAKPKQAGKQEVSGKITVPGAPRTAAQAVVETTNKAADEDIKRSIEAGEAYRGQEEKIGDLILTRNRFNNSLKQAISLYGAESEQAKRLRGAIAGVNEQIEAARKKGGNEAQQVLDAQLEQRVKQAKDALAQEQAGIAFSQKYLQGTYQAGVTSLRDLYEAKRKAISDGVAAELAELDKERDAVNAHLAATKRTSPKDASAIVKDQTRLNDIDAEKGKIQTSGAREIVLNNQEEAASFKALAESVLGYRANLLQMQGDEAGAARLRALIVIQNARLLAAQAKGAGVGDVDVSGLARATAVTDQFNEVQRQASLLSTASQRAEEAYGLAAEQTGLSLRDTEQGIYRIRASELQQLGALTEQAKALAEASTDPRIKQFAADLALQYAKAAQAIDPALNRLREAQRELASGISQTVAAAPVNFANYFNQRRSQLEQDTKSQKDEYAKQIDQLRGYLAEERDARNKASLQKRIDQLQSESDNLHVESKGKTALNALTKTVLEPIGQSIFTTVNKLLIQDPLQKYLEGQLKGLTEGDGPLAGFFKDTLGIQSDPKQQALLEQTAAIGASTQALDVLRAAAENAANALNNHPAAGEPLANGNQGVAAQTGDSQSPAIDPSLDGAQGDATDSLATFGKQASSSASDVLRLANAAGAGGGAMARLPGIVGLFQSAVMAMQGGSAASSGGLFGAIAGLFGSSSNTSAGLMDYGEAVKLTGIFHKGGIIGQAKETRSVASSVFANAPRYHTGGLVGRAADKHAALRHNEVAAILMGGPKGKREEVLTADDPRHRDNLGMSIVAKIMAESRAGLKVSGARELGGPVSANSLYRVNEKGVDKPELLQVAGKQYLMTGNQSGAVLPAAPTAKGGDTHIHVTVAPPQGATRQTAMQFGATAAREISRARRNM